MPACILHILGESFDVDSFLSAHENWKPFRIDRKGETKHNREVQKHGFRLVVTENEEFDTQVKEAQLFFEAHLKYFQDLATHSAEATLSFAKNCDFEKHSFPYVRFPARFINMAASCGVNIEVGIFPKSHEAAA